MIKTLFTPILFLCFSICLSEEVDTSLVAPADSIPISDSLLSQDSSNSEVVTLEILKETTYEIIDTVSRKIDLKIDSLSNHIKNIERNSSIAADNLDSLLILEKKNNKELVEKIDNLEKTLSTMNIDRWGIGYEEGLSLRVRLGKNNNPMKKQFLTILGFNYSYTNPSNGMQQKLHEGHLKLGLLREVAVFPKTRISAYLDFIEKFKQIETDPLITDPYTFNKYNMWISTGRAGLMLTVLSLKHFMFSFKFGLEFSYFTPAYMNNESNTALMRVNNGIFKWGINTGELSILETLINNIGIYVYF